LVVLCDFHTHSLLSDGVLSPIELLRRAVVKGYRAIAITDHMSLGTLEGYLPVVIKECELAERYWDIVAIPGIELTHLPPETIAEAARTAKELGARLVVVHGETVVEPVHPGTNLAALRSPHVDILAHPGLLSPEEAQLAAANGVFLEISARKGHCLTNGHVVRLGQAAGARFLVNSDAHEPGDLLSPELALSVALGSGLGQEEIRSHLPASVAALLNKLGVVEARWRRPSG
jgi:histidinol phosphatase-like PHP family hydrolase